MGVVPREDLSEKTYPMSNSSIFYGTHRHACEGGHPVGGRMVLGSRLFGNDDGDMVGREWPKPNDNGFGSLKRRCTFFSTSRIPYGGGMAQNWRLERVISGGQTGVDRAALDVALEFGIKISGYCPRGRKAEDGIVPDKYPLMETDSEDYETRTEKNVEISDGTLILNVGQLTGGTGVTVGFARKHGKPVFTVQLDRDRPDACEKCRQWLRKNRIRILNVAGPRASKSPGISEQAVEYLRGVFGALGEQS
jgi:hypothetical protein